jgi:hypothetical protein
LIKLLVRAPNKSRIIGVCVDPSRLGITCETSDLSTGDLKTKYKASVQQFNVPRRTIIIPMQNCMLVASDIELFEFQEKQDHFSASFNEVSEVWKRL